MQVVLLERIEKLGQIGDIVSVKPGYARNFLLLKGKALRATSGNLARFETERSQIEARNLEKKSEAEAVSGKLDGAAFIVIRQAGDSGQLYGSVSARDIAEVATADGYSLDKGQVVLNAPIKMIGLHDVTVRLHADVRCAITVNVARTDDEARLQAQGQDVLAMAEEDDELNAEKFFGEAIDVSALEDDAEGDADETEGEPTADDAAETDSEEETS